jgi:hypothetical protein
MADEHQQYLSELEDFKTKEEETYDISDDPTVGHLTSLQEETILPNTDAFFERKSKRKVQAARDSAPAVAGGKHRSSSKKRFLFTNGEIEKHDKSVMENSYKVTDFQEHLARHLGRRRSTGNASTLHVPVVETLQAKNPRLQVKISSPEASRKQSSAALSDSSGGGNANIIVLSNDEIAVGSQSPSTSLSPSSSVASSRKSSALLNANLRKQSSPAILEKRALHGIPISPQIALPSIDIPPPKVDLGEIVVEHSLRDMLRKALALEDKLNL